ncbi:MAG TPA: glycosyltransferase family 2 protein [Solirubrobacteraceae bacterium]|jgi:GT2 family glycosyltransferase|nr:glycosyltransferase family 2 protein [Solirubrobacteraceae bacterium]
MIGLVHLVWAPLGPEPLRAFLRSYHAHAAGADHELVILLNGDGASLTREELLAELVDTQHQVIALKQPLTDLAAYGEAATRLEHEWLCFLNSYSVILADGWLGHLARAAQQPRVGIAGATGSWESQAEWRRGQAKSWLRQLSAVRSQRRDYPRFPNPHIRTTACLLRRQAVLDLDLGAASDKRAAYLLESGRNGITRQLGERGQRAVVVGRDGCAYEVEDWPLSRTYRSGEQDNLLVADNRTADWLQAPRRLRRQLSHDAWGARAPRIRAELADTTVTAAAVAIVNYRTPELVERCLEAVWATSDGVNLEVVVIDNASRDGSVERLRAGLPRTKVVAMDENRGFAAGVNACFRNTRAELVLVLNPDTEVKPGAVVALLKHLRSHPETGLVAPLLEDVEGHLVSNGYRRFPGLGMLTLDLCLPLSYALAYAPSLHPYALAPEALRKGVQPAHVCGAVMAIRRKAYTETGPLDEGFFLYLEETEWQRRMALRGWRIEVLPTARVRHLVRGGGDGALAPSLHFVAGAVRYLSLRGIPPLLSRAALALALASSWATVSLIACLPDKRTRATRQARAYRALLRLALSGNEVPRG